MSLDKKQIYIVDDDESVGRALKLLLGTYGFMVETFLSAEEFLNTVSNSAPGCLIMDVHMPGLNGWQAQEKLRKMEPARPVIFISAQKNGDLKAQALKAGAVGFLQKPFGDQELVDLINLTF